MYQLPRKRESVTLVRVTRTSVGTILARNGRAQPPLPTISEPGRTKEARVPDGHPAWPLLLPYHAEDQQTVSERLAAQPGQPFAEPNRQRAGLMAAALVVGQVL
jgi:hypothetical protein